MSHIYANRWQHFLLPHFCCCARKWWPQIWAPLVGQPGLHCCHVKCAEASLNTDDTKTTTTSTSILDATFGQSLKELLQRSEFLDFETGETKSMESRRWISLMYDATLHDSKGCICWARDASYQALVDLYPSFLLFIPRTCSIESVQ